MKSIFLAVVLGLAVTASPAGAGSAVQTWEFTLPELPQGLLLLYFGPPSGSEIVKTRLVAEFQAEPERLEAQDLTLQLSPFAPVAPWYLTGADLGWGAGPGPFTALVETDQFNGLIETDLWEIAIDALAGPYQGGGRFLNNSRFEVDYIVPEPASLALLGLSGHVILRRRRRG